MYGWLCGIIFSKLALSTSFVAASVAEHDRERSRTDDHAPQPVVEDQPLEQVARMRSNSARPRTTGI